MADQGAVPHLQRRLLARMKALQAQGMTKEQIRAELPRLRSEVTEGFTGFPGQEGENAFGEPKAQTARAFPPIVPPPEPQAEGIMPAIGRGAMSAVEGGANVLRSVAGGVVGGRTLGVFGPEANLQRAEQSLRDLDESARRGELVTPTSARRAREEVANAHRDLQARQKHPILGGIADVVGSFQGLGAKVTNNISRVPVKGPSSVNLPGAWSWQEALRDSLAGAVGAGVETTGRALVEERGAREALDAGAAAAVLGGILGPLPRMANAYLTDPRKLSGRQINALNKGQEFLNSPAAKRLDEGLSGVGQLATLEGGELGAMQAKRLADAQARIKAREEALLPPAGKVVPEDVSQVHAGLDRGVRKYEVSGEPIRDELVPLVDKYKKKLSGPERETFVPTERTQSLDVDEVAGSGYAGTPGFTAGGVREGLPVQRLMLTDGTPRSEPGHGMPTRKPNTRTRSRRRGAPVDLPSAAERPIEGEYAPPQGPEMPPAPPPGEDIAFESAGPSRLPIASRKDLLAARRQVRELSEPGLPTTPENAPYKSFYGVLADATHTDDELGRALAASDKEFAADMDFLEAGNARLFNREDARAVTDSVAARRAAGQKLSRALGDTHASGMRAVELDELASLGPEYAAAIDRVRAKVAFEGTRFGLPRGMVSNPSQWSLQPLIANYNGLKARVVEPLTRTPGLAPGLANQAVDIINARVKGKRSEDEKKKEKR